MQRAWQQPRMPLCRQCRLGLQPRMIRLPPVRALLCIRLLRSCVLSLGSCKQAGHEAPPGVLLCVLSCLIWSKGLPAMLSRPDRRTAGCAAGQALLEHFVASRALRRLLLRGKSCSPDAEQAQTFADKLWSKRLQGHCNQLVAGHAAKVSCQHPPTCTQSLVKHCHAGLATLCSCCTTIAQSSQ